MNPPAYWLCSKHHLTFWSQLVDNCTYDMKQFTILILLLVLISLNCAIEIIARKNDDLNTVDGVEAELICEVEDIRDPLEECYWYR